MASLGCKELIEACLSVTISLNGCFLSPALIVTKTKEKQSPSSSEGHVQQFALSLQ